MISNMDHDMSGIFKWILGIAASLFTGLTLIIGKRVLGLDREMGEMKGEVKAAHEGFKRDIADIKSDIRAIREHLEGRR